MGNLTRPLMRFVRGCKLASSSDPYDELCTAALNMPPPLPQRPKVVRITEELLCSYGAAARCQVAPWWRHSQLHWPHWAGSPGASGQATEPRRARWEAVAWPKAANVSACIS